MDIPIWQVVVMGMVTVFICLICLVILSMLVSAVIRAFTKKEEPAVASAAVAAPIAVAPIMPNKQQLIAAIGVAIAEDMGTDVSHIRIHSIKKI